MRATRLTAAALVLAALTLTAAVIWQPGAALAQGEGKGKGERPKWEYKVISFASDFKDVEKELNKLGEDGWECVGVSDNVSGRGGNVTTTRVIFKRSAQ